MSIQRKSAERMKLALQMAEWEAAGGIPDVLPYGMKSEDKGIDAAYRRADGTLTGGSNSRLFLKDEAKQ